MAPLSSGPLALLSKAIESADHVSIKKYSQTVLQCAQVNENAGSHWISKVEAFENPFLVKVQKAYLCSLLYLTSYSSLVSHIHPYYIQATSSDNSSSSSALLYLWHFWFEYVYSLYGLKKYKVALESLASINSLTFTAGGIQTGDTPQLSDRSSWMTLQAQLLYQNESFNESCELYQTLIHRSSPHSELLPLYWTNYLAASIYQHPSLSTLSMDAELLEFLNGPSENPFEVLFNHALWLERKGEKIDLNTPVTLLESALTLCRHQGGVEKDFNEIKCQVNILKLRQLLLAKKSNIIQNHTQQQQQLIENIRSFFCDCLKNKTLSENSLLIISLNTLLLDLHFSPSLLSHPSLKVADDAIIAFNRNPSLPFVLQLDSCYQYVLALLLQHPEHLVSCPMKRAIRLLSSDQVPSESLVKSKLLVCLYFIKMRNFKQAQTILNSLVDEKKKVWSQTVTSEKLSIELFSLSLLLITTSSSPSSSISILFEDWVNCLVDYAKEASNSSNTHVSSLLMEATKLAMVIDPSGHLALSRLIEPLFVNESLQVTLTKLKIALAVSQPSYTDVEKTISDAFELFRTRSLNIVKVMEDDPEFLTLLIRAWVASSSNFRLAHATNPLWKEISTYLTTKVPLQALITDLSPPAANLNKETKTMKHERTHHVHVQERKTKRKQRRHHRRLSRLFRVHGVSFTLIESLSLDQPVGCLPAPDPKRWNPSLTKRKN